MTISGKAGTLTVRDLKIDFSVSKGIGSSQNEAKISIWNLTKSHRKQLGDELDKIELKVGYKDGPLSTIFKGSIRDSTDTKDSPDIESAIDCGDGDEAVSKGAASKTFKKGTKPKEIVEYLVGQLPGVAKGEMKGLDDLPAYKRPVTVFGHAAAELDKIGRQHRLYWSIQDGTAQVLKNNEMLPGVTVISEDTGMIGIPQTTDKGIRVKTLLNPNIAPGRQIDVRSGFLDEGSGRDKSKTDQGGGIFRVSQVTFTGTNEGDDWYAEIEANRAEGGKVVR
ncbi:hypothetical protein ASE63_22460 [Bosea sp. Root381]|uniref:phage protein n=1 Tax=Bosea sp. Root381 TaxID=1736524 RepID=UPI0007144A0D|nr:hypothetical protein [Bosea sp. Root381]KRE07465.1 hypothetical protein ASE63_22460 [Bosea sp. Root381]